MDLKNIKDFYLMKNTISKVKRFKTRKDVCNF